MPENISPRKIQELARAGFERLKRYRKVRAAFIREYVGQYYRADKGVSGQEPLNLIFTAIRSIIPQIVMRNPLNKVVTRILSQRDYAELLSLGLDRVEEDINLKDTIRAWVVDALFGLGIVKTGLCTSDQCVIFDDLDVDPGKVYTEIVDLDNFTMDPLATSLDKAFFTGDLIRVPRQQLLDIEGYDKDLVRRLPKSSSGMQKNKVEDLTKKNAQTMTMFDARDYVDVVQLHIPDANKMVVIPDPRVAIFEKFIYEVDYFGPEAGPYTYLSLTPPVPNNPLPVAPAGVWLDLHRLGNEMFVKLANQASRQKDITFYNPAQADEMDEARTSQDGDCIQSSDPSGFKTVSFGGQRPENERWLGQLQTWFNYVAGNPDQLSGLRQESETATQAEILQANANISIEDVRGIVYDSGSRISKKIAWYLHYDPLMDLPLIKRNAEGAEVQARLTPEERTGDFLKFTFKFIPKSMSKLDPIIRSKRIIEFLTKVMPQIVLAAQEMIKMGIPFNLQKTLTKAAEELDIGDWFIDLWDDSELQQRLELMLLMGPAKPGKSGGGTTDAAGAMQNEGFPVQQTVQTPQQDINQGRQEVAGVSQSARIV